MEKSSEPRDYRDYRFDRWEWARAAAVCSGAVIFLAMVFYRSAWAVLPLAPIGCFLMKQMRARKGEKLRLELAEQFKECILSVSASLQAGYAVENAFLESRDDMGKLYGKDSLIYEELERIRRGLVVSIPLEQLLLDLGERSGNEEMLQFAQMFSIAKRGGGSIPEMIRTSANLISQKLEAGQEIRVMLSGRRMEQNIMKLMPFGILFYVGSTYPGYFEPLYHNAAGVAVMSVCLGLYLAACIIGERVFQGIWRQMEGIVEPVKLPGLQRTGIFGRLAHIGEVLYVWGQGRVPGCPGRERVRRSLEMLCPEDAKGNLLTQYYGGKIGLSLLVFIVGSFLALCLQMRRISGSSRGNVALVIWGMTVGAAAAVFFLMDKDLQDQVERRKKVMRLGYPDLVHRLALYLVAGMTIRGAFRKLGETNELARVAVREMQSGQSETVAYEHFGKRAGPREYVRLSTLLCQNLKKGNGTLLPRLEEEAVMAAERRLQNGKRLGEEAETKLLIPMVILLAVVMLMIMVPAFSVMGI